MQEDLGLEISFESLFLLNHLVLEAAIKTSINDNSVTVAWTMINLEGLSGVQSFLKPMEVQELTIAA